MKPEATRALLHVYPSMAGIDDAERRRLMVQIAGIYSARQPIGARNFDKLMAEFERILWDRVDAGHARDPRLCRSCGKPLVRLDNGFGACPLNCERRKVYAWTRDYWQSRSSGRAGAASTRQVWKLKQLWTLLQDYLQDVDRTESYLARIIADAAPSQDGLRQTAAGDILWDTISLVQAAATIEALKDRLKHAVK